jgi:predicted ATPase
VFVDFTTVTSEPMLINRIADALRLPVSSTSLEASLLNCLQDRKMLLIFDNCEHVVEASAHLIERILRACSGALCDRIIPQRDLVTLVHGNLRRTFYGIRPDVERSTD